MSALLTPEQICQRYVISMSTLYQWTAQRRIPYLKIRGMLRFREKDIEKWEEGQVSVPRGNLL